MIRAGSELVKESPGASQGAAGFAGVRRRATLLRWCGFGGGSFRVVAMTSDGCRSGWLQHLRRDLQAVAGLVPHVASAACAAVSDRRRIKL
jgi:hypothetical protein